MKQKLSLNISNTITREESLEGVDYIVSPAVLIVEGLLNNIFYPKSEISKYPDAWNGEPVTVGHSDASANSPDVLEALQVGMLFNTHVVDDGAKLKSEIWFDKAKCLAKAPEILDKLTKNEIIEVSTGVFVDEVKQTGMFNGVIYDSVATNYRPDHLAILLDGEGACSVSDGAGTPRLNNKKDKDSLTTKAFKTLANSMGYKLNKLTHRTIRQKLSDSIKSNITNSSITSWVTDVYDDSVIWEEETHDTTNNIYKSKYYKQNYTNVEDVITLVNDKVEVEKVVEYKEINQNKPKINKEKGMDREEKVQALIKKNSAWTETNAEFLRGLTDDQFDAVEKATIEPVDAPKTNSEKTTEPAKQMETELTVEEFLVKAPTAIQSLLTDGLKLHEDKKTALVSKIKLNKRNMFTDEALLSKDISELEAIASLSETAPDFAGRGEQPITNNASVDSVPDMPAIKWGNK